MENNNIPVKFTQEIKDNWLANLKSGKYVQGIGRLVREVPLKQHCCLGVLGDCTDGLNNDLMSGTDPYYFLTNNIGHSYMERLWKTNDRLTDGDNRDYSNVIPLIEALPVTD